MENADQPHMDAGRTLQQMELMAWSEGMGTCFVTLTPEQNATAKELLGIPGGVDLITVLPFGYRRDDFQGRGVPPKAHRRARPRREVRQPVRRLAAPVLPHHRPERSAWAWSGSL